MSSIAVLRWDEGEGMDAEAWAAFCQRHGIRYSPHTVGRNCFYGPGGVEICFGEAVFGNEPRRADGRIDFDAMEPPAHADEITLSVSYGGNCDLVAALAYPLWLDYGGHMYASPEVRHAFRWERVA